ncbi:hypothetical protein ACNI3Q_11175 [Sphingomonas sp. FW199]|nr:hypothetical protein [Sphingomonas sp. BGYR3]MDG5488308.1 hypothetical protein [Sphingomonas sp. BGYR3]
MTPCPAVAPAPTGALRWPSRPRAITLPPLTAPSGAGDRRTLH